MGVLTARARLFGVYIGDPNLWKFPVVHRRLAQGFRLYFIDACANDQGSVLVAACSHAFWAVVFYTQALELLMSQRTWDLGPNVISPG